MTISNLPKEVLLEIIKRLPGGYPPLLNCSQTCRLLWEIATAALYRDIDLQFEERYDEDADEKTDRRQFSFMKSIAENPKLGASVRSFANSNPYLKEEKDVTQKDEADKCMLISAAKNMKYLTKASFTRNPLAIHVIMNLPSYPQLSDLTIDGVNPELHIWKNAPTALRKLKWKIPYSRYGPDAKSPWDEPQFLLKVVEASCPNLEEIDMSLCNMGRQDNEDIVAAEVVEEYKSIPDTTEVKLTHLRHFGFKIASAYPNEEQHTAIENYILGFVGKHKQTLQSLTLPVNIGTWSREKVDFILKLCSLLPDLKELTLADTYNGFKNHAEMTAFEFFYALTSSPATAKMERFSVKDMKQHFSKEIGRCFQSWKNLKFLRIGDEENGGGPFGNEGRIQFDDYRPHILKFVQALPPSIQELYLEINGEDLWCDDDDDFDPICNMGPAIFRSQPRLHTCDIHGWFSNCDGGLGLIPEKAVFYRRLSNSLSSEKVKDVWTSRMDCIYQDEDILVSKNVDVLENESFEGEDAKELWLDGFEFSKTRSGTQRGRQVKEDDPDYSWPFYKDKISNYAMWRERR